jgi:hypothetical protein
MPQPAACDYGAQDAFHALEGLRCELEGAIIEFVAAAALEGWSEVEIDTALQRCGCSFEARKEVADVRH